MSNTIIQTGGGIFGNVVSAISGATQAVKMSAGTIKSGLTKAVNAGILTGVGLLNNPLMNMVGKSCDKTKVLQCAVENGPETIACISTLEIGGEGCFEPPLSTCLLNACGFGNMINTGNLLSVKDFMKSNIFKKT